MSLKRSFHFELEVMHSEEQPLHWPKTKKLASLVSVPLIIGKRYMHDFKSISHPFFSRLL